MSLNRLKVFVTGAEKSLLVCSVVAAVAQGAALPAFSLIFGNVIDIIGKGGQNVMDDVSRQCLILGLFAVSMFFAAAFWHFGFSTVSLRLASRLRVAYLQTFMQKDVVWYDLWSPAELPVESENNVMRIQEAVGFKRGLFIANVSQLLVGYGVALYRGWHLTLVVMSVVPFVAYLGSRLESTMTSLDSQTVAINGKAGAVAEEVFGGIRTVASFNGQIKEISRYESLIADARTKMTSVGMKLAMTVGATMGLFYFSFALAYFVGGKLVEAGVHNPSQNGAYTGGDVMTIIFCVMIGTFGMGQAVAALGVFAEGERAATDFWACQDDLGEIEAVALKKGHFPFKEVDKSMKIVAAPNTILSPGSILMHQLQFSYASRPDVAVLKNVSIEIPKGSKVALVGSSGSSKSTLASLLLRFYDPTSGGIFHVQDDGSLVDARSVDVQTWRRRFAYVGQEPVLFAATVRENLLYGLTASELTDTDLAAVCKKAGAWDFIKSLPEGLSTYCGPGGSQFSGGQKQRIAIARSLLRNPEVLILDEATSALDYTSERVVQEAIDNLMAESNLTVVVIAHRLSTVRFADRICVLRLGELVEVGKHDVLMNSVDGVYRSLVLAQTESQVEAVSPTKNAEGQSPQRLPGNALATTDKSNIPVGLVSAAAGSNSSDAKPVPFSRLFAFTKADSALLLPAFLGSALKGCSQPVMGYLMSQMMGDFYLSEKSEMMRRITISSGAFLAVAVGVFFSATLQIGLFARIGQGFTYRARSALFRRLVFKDIEFFDEPIHTPGVLSDVLATKTERMARISGESFGVFLEMITSVVCGMVIGFVASPALAGVVLAMMPLTSFAEYAQAKVYMGAQKATGHAKQKAIQVVSEAVQNIRTLKAARAEQFVVDLYVKYLAEGAAKQQRECLFGAFTYGISLGIVIGAYAVGFYYGGYLVVNHGLNVVKFTQGLMGILMAAAGAGQALVFMPDANKAKVAAVEYFAISDRKNKIHPDDTDITLPSIPSQDEKTAPIVQIEFRHVVFRYPARPGVSVLQGLSFVVDCPTASSLTVALVGNSGGGKSSVMSLLQRFYDPNEGAILINGVNIKSMDVFQLRRIIASVSQEPTLFDLSLRANLLYGVSDEIPVTPAAIDDALATAAVDFVPSTLQLDDRVGAKGCLLSGGQKQRVAIARALLKESPVMVFDEATSALDSANERLVQLAIDRSTKDKLSFVIAHRLSTIKHADKILVINQGKLLESGSHTELMANNNLYAQLFSQGLSLRA